MGILDGFIISYANLKPKNSIDCYSYQSKTRAQSVKPTSHTPSHPTLLVSYGTWGALQAVNPSRSSERKAQFVDFTASIFAGIRQPFAVVRVAFKISSKDPHGPLPLTPSTIVVVGVATTSTPEITEALLLRGGIDGLWGMWDS